MRRLILSVAVACFLVVGPGWLALGQGRGFSTTGETYNKRTGRLNQTPEGRVGVGYRWDAEYERLLYGPLKECDGFVTHADKRYSWELWWEWRRDEYLNLDHEGLEEAASYAGDRAAAVAGLLVALKRDGPVRAAAAIALGRMRATEVMDDLVELVELPRTLENEEVRLAGWIALGLLDSPESGAYLGEKLKTLEHARKLVTLTTSEVMELTEMMACVSGIGLLSEMPAGAEAKLLKLVSYSHRSRELRRLALWALCEHDAAKHRRLLHQVIAGSKETFLVIEAIEGLAKAQDIRDVETLRRLATIPKAVASPRLPVIFLKGSGIETRVYKRLAAMRALGRFRQDEHRSVMEVELMKLTKYKPVGKAQMHWLEFELALTLGLTAPRYAPGMLTNATKGEKWDEDQPWFSQQWGCGYIPVRPFTAIGLGLLMHRMNEWDVLGAGLTDEALALGVKELPALRSEMLEALHDTLVNTSESPHQRAASALGIGLSGSSRQIPRLLRVLDQIGKKDEATYGHVVLALGMLGDKKLPYRLLGYMKPANKIDTEAVLKKKLKSNYTHDRRMSRRLAVTALGVLGEPNAAQMLVGEWGKDPFVSLEVGRSLRALKDTSITGAMVELMGQDEEPLVAEVAALTLGELYDPESSARIRRLQRMHCDWHQYGVWERILKRPGMSLSSYLIRYSHRYLITHNGKKPSVGDIPMNTMTDDLHWFGNPYTYRYLWQDAYEEPEKSLGGFGNLLNR